MSFLYGGIVLALLLWVGPKLHTLHRNYHAARATGLPIVVCPYDPDSLMHTVFSDLLRPVLRYLLPSSIYAAFEITTYGWEFRDKAAVHERLGPVFMIVTTGLNRLICADPAIAHTILSKRKEFFHPDINVQAMGFLGKNIVTNDDEAWSRQRRIIAPALSERIMPEVWKEGIEQGSAFAGLLVKFTGGTTDTISGLRAVAINVLTLVAYGCHKPFALPTSDYDPSAHMSYVDAISLCTDFLIVAAFVPAYLLTLPVMPRSMHTLGVALKRLPDLTKDMLEQERKSSSEVTITDQAAKAGPSKPQNTIMRTLVRLSDQLKEQADDKTSTSKEKNLTTVGGKSYLTEEEIGGNLFIFTAAGFDTTANTMAYAITLLAAHPEWQTWIQEEIDTVLTGLAPSEGDELAQPVYATTFPKLTRCLAVMFETLRLFPPVTTVARSTKMAQTVAFPNSSTDSINLGVRCALHVNTMALHTSPSAWSPDALEFNPARWLQPASEEEASETLMTPPRGTFLPWSVGPRVCPGQKMSQVEFVSVMMVLFRRCTVEAVPVNGESVHQARQKLLNLAQDSQPVLTLQMNNPKGVNLRWVSRVVNKKAA